MPKPFDSAASGLVSESAHPLEQLELLEEKARDLESLGDSDAVIECRIKQLCLQRVLVFLHDFPKPGVVRAEIVLAEAYAGGSYFKQAREHLARAHEASGVNVFDDAQCQKLQVDLLLAEGVVQLAEGHRDKAHSTLSEASRLGREAFGEMDARSARVHTMLGQISRHRQRYPEAIDHFSAAWEVHEQVHGRDAEETLAMWLRIAEVEHLDGRTEEAIVTQTKAVKQLQLAGALPVLTIDATTQLARWLEAQGRDAEALEQLQAAERIVAENLGPEDPKAVEIKRDVALLHLKSGDHDTALRYLNDVHYFERRLHGGQSAGVARTLKALGTVHMVRRNFDDAEQCLLQALRIFEGDPQNAAIVRDINSKLRNIETLARQEFG